MIRNLLNNIPDVGLVIIFVIIPIIISLFALYFVRKQLGKSKTELSSGAVGIVAGIVTTFFALVLAFAIVNLYQTYQDAAYNTNSEANALTAIGHDSLVFPTAVQTSVQHAIANYIVELQTREFPAMRLGHLSPTTDPKLEDIYRVLQNYNPKTQSQIAFYNSAITQLNQVLINRENRVNDADSSLPTAFVVLIFLTGILSVFTALFIKTDVTFLEYLLVGNVAAVVGIGWLTVVLLEYPFSGSVSVSSAVYTQGYLGHLVSLYH